MQAIRQTKSERLAYGLRVRALRERLGMTRDAFGQKIGVSGSTVKQVELGYQNLGEAARFALARLEENGTVSHAVAERTVRYDEPPRDHDAVIDRVVALVMNREFLPRAEQVAKVIGTTTEDAVRMLVRHELEKGQ